MPWTPNLTETEWAYVAGILDGEGNLGVYLRSSQNRGSRQITPSANYKPRLSVSNTNLELLTWLVARLRGDIKAKGKRVFGCKQGYTWRQDAIATLQEICRRTLPYLVIKKRQAELCLEFPANVSCNQWTKTKTSALRATKSKLYDETLRLNRRGVSEAIQ